MGVQSRCARLITLLGVLCSITSLTTAAYASDADAIAIERNLQARHLPFGTVADPVFSSPTSTQIIGYTRCGDSALWTGHYLAAEAYHYSATGSAEALANVKSALAGLKLLVDVTGTNLLARCAVPTNSPYNAYVTSEESHNGIYQNTAMGYSWVGNTSRDQYSGVMFGLGVAYDYVNDAGVKASINDLTTRMLDYLIGHLWTVIMPDGTISTTFIGRADQQLSFLQVGQHINPSKYASVYSSNRLLLAAAVLTPIALETTSNSSYFKFNLDYINLYNLIRLGSGVDSAIYLPAYTTLRSATQDHQNAFFNMIDRALTGANAARDADTLNYLNQWLQRPRRDVYVDNRGKIASCGSPDEACNPVPIPLRVTTDFLWQRDPYLLDGGGSGTVEGAGIDYILPWWMARVYNLATSASVVSSASNASGFAPNSLATFYGTGLATTTQAAGSSTLPTTLGGVTVQITDSAGTARLAPLYFVSPTQINFQVPSGAALGSATVKVSTGSTATINVQSVAPTLFSADSSGSGPAAATAIRTTIPTNIQTPIPVFQCSSTGCTTVPLVLGVDQPIYVTLYGTGIQGRSLLNNVSVSIHGTPISVLYAGPQNQYPGLDQVNIGIPLSLRGAGESDVVLTVDGQMSNTVRINIQ